MNKINPGWVEPAQVTIPTEILDLAGGSQLLAEALIRRGLTDPASVTAFLDPQAYSPAAPAELPDLLLAADRLERAIQQGEVIGVWGDFDVDGQTATALLVQSLRAFGAKVQYYIPVRSRDSHGVALPALKSFLQTGVDLVLTCDTGITAHDAAQYLHTHKIDLLITDHHALPAELPQALAVVNPQRLPSNHSLSYLCGAGCAYKLAEELFRRSGRAVETEALLDLATLGTIADLALLSGDNRYLVQKGLEILRTNPRPAVAAILELAGVAYAQLSEEQVSYTIAPRLNALGRLDDANPAVAFLLSTAIADARPMAARLEALNAQRKMLCDQVFQAVLARLAQDRSILDHPVLILHHPTWPNGVLGIVASRLVELYHRPTILFAGPPGELARGSARSIEGIHITQAITACSHLLGSFGGHPMAAGLSIDLSRLPEFQRAIDQAVLRQSGAEQPVADLPIDAFISLNHISLSMVEALERLAPFGPGNPPLILATQNLVLQSQAAFGKTGEHLQLIVEDPLGQTQKVLWWQGAGSPLPEGRFDLAYTVRASNYRGQRTVQVEWIGYRSMEEEQPLHVSRRAFKIEDHRGELTPAALLAETLSNSEITVYAEGEHGLDQPCVDRYHLTSVNHLVIWSTPPGPQELRMILNAAHPQTVIWFGVSSSTDQPNTFLTRLTGLVRYVLKNRDGRSTISALASSTGQRERTIHLGLEWLECRGYITLIKESNDEITLTAGGQSRPEKLSRVESSLAFLLQETAAFRSYCNKANLQTLLSNGSDSNSG